MLAKIAAVITVTAAAAYAVVYPTYPEILSFTPSSATAGAPAFTLTVNGANFLPGAKVQVGCCLMAATFASSTQLRVPVPSSLVASPGNLLIQVINPDGYASFIPPLFTINPPVRQPPSIANLEPGAAGDQYYPGFPVSLTVNGVFSAGSVVQWNGSPLSTTVVSSTKLTVSVLPSMLSTAGTAIVTVLAGGVVSNAVPFYVVPGPHIFSTSPSSATVGGSAFSMTVYGRGFQQNSTAVMGNTSRGVDNTNVAVTFVSSTQLAVAVPANLIATPGHLTLVIYTPSGGASEFWNFEVGIPPLSITTTSPLPSGTVGVPYSQALSASGGTPPYKNWMIFPGPAPPGLSLATLGGVLTGLLTGTPTTAGTFTFTVQVNDSAAPASAIATKQFTLTVSPAPGIISAAGIVNAASYAGGGVAPGEIVTIYGSGWGPSSPAGLQLDSHGFVTNSLGGTQVLFDGIAAPLIYAQAGQLSAVVPYAVNNKSLTQVQVMYQGLGSNAISVPVVPTAPGIFTLDSSGRGAGAIVNQDGTVNSPSNPAPAGSLVFVYATGEGQTNPPGVDGKPNDNPAPTPVGQPVTATIGGMDAQVLYAGGVPGLVAGVLQLNVQVPKGIAPGASVPIGLTIAGRSSQANVTVAISAARD